jgi:hypothetical protein
MSPKTKKSYKSKKELCVLLLGHKVLLIVGLNFNYDYILSMPYYFLYSLILSYTLISLYNNIPLFVDTLVCIFLADLDSADFTTYGLR